MYISMLLGLEVDLHMIMKEDDGMRVLMKEMLMKFVFVFVFVFWKVGLECLRRKREVW